MVQAFDRLVRRRAVLALASMLLAGCQYFSPPAQACPEVIEAEAWVNRMPSIGASPTKLIVSLKISAADPWMLKSADTAEEGALVLDMVPGGNSVPGTVAYRQAQPSPLPETIGIMCRGDEIARIHEILIVQ